MDLVAGPVEETGVDESYPVFRGADAFLEVDRGPALFVHNAELYRVLRQAEHLFHMGKDLIGESHFFWPVHLGLDHIDRTLDRIAALALQIVHSDQRRYGGVHQPFENLVAIAIKDRRIGHQVAHVADPQERTALDRGFLAAGVKKRQIGVQPAGEGLPALGDLLGQIALHQAKPVAIGYHLVLGIDASDRIFAIHDRRQGALEAHIRQKRLIAAADEMGAVEHQFDVQAVVAQDHRMRRLGVAAVAHEFLGADKRQVVDQKLPLLHMIAAHIGVAGAGNRESLVQKNPRPRHNPRAPAPLIPALGNRAGHGVGAIEAIIKAAPTGIRGVQRIAGVGDRHHKLRASDRSNLGVDIRGADPEILALGHKIANLAKEGFVGLVVMRLVAMGDVPGVDLGLKVIALGQKRPILGAKVVDKARQPLPEGRRRKAGAVQRFCLDKGRQFRGNLEPVSLHTFDHRPTSLTVCIGMPGFSAT